MPKFTETEKEAIRSTLISEGEKLFSKYGIKKVTVDELVNAASIAKGSFYSFYTNKEELYMDIITRKQNQLWQSLDTFIEENKGIEPKLLVKKTFLRYIKSAEQSEILKQVDSAIIEYLYRKVPEKVIEETTSDDNIRPLDFSEYGVRFRCDITHIGKALQQLYKTSLDLEENDPENKDEVVNILLEGLVIRTVY